MLRRVKLWIRRIRLWMVKRVMSWEEYWDRNLPPIEYPMGDDRKVVKDGRYWQDVAVVIENRAFINELAEAQKEVDDIIRRDLMKGESLEAVRRKLLVLHGMRKVNDILIAAHNRAVKSNKDRGE